MQESQFSLFSFIMGIMSSAAAYYIVKLIEKYLSVREAQKPTEQFWDFLFSDTTVVLSAHGRYFGMTHAVCWTSFGDVQSLRDFYLFFYTGFLSLYRRIRFKWQPSYQESVSFLGSEEDWSGHRCSNMVIIGGPAYNMKTRRILIDIHRRLTPRSQDKIYHGDGFWKGRSYDPHTSTPTYDPELTKLLNQPSSAIDYPDEVFTNRLRTKSRGPVPGTDDELQTDYGIAIKCSNPYRVDKRVVIVYGAFDSGTKGAMDYITSGTKLRELLTTVGSNNNLWVLVEATLEKRRAHDEIFLTCQGYNPSYIGACRIG